MVRKEKIKKNLKKQGPITTIIILTLIIALITLVLSIFKVSGSVTEAGTLETSVITINNIFSKEGIKYLLINSVTNFKLMDSIIYIIMALIAVSILETSGLLKHIVNPLKNMKSKYVTLIVVFIGIISTFIGDYSYALLLPLVGAAYKILGKSPALGVITAFIGITIGYGVGLIPNYQDYMLGVITESSASSIDNTYKFKLSSTCFITTTIVIILSIFGTLFIEKSLGKKFNRYEEKDNLNMSRTALIISGSVFFVLLALIIYSIIPGLPFSGILLNSSNPVYIVKLFGPDAAFGNGLMLIIMMLCLVTSYIYGRISGNIRNGNDYTHSLTKSFENTGYIFTLMFFASIMLGLLEWSNLGSVIATNIVDFIGTLRFSGVLLIFVMFIAIIIMSILMPIALTKWELIAPVFVPVLMRANISPTFAQVIFVSADSIGKLFSPIYIYLIIAIGFLYKNDENTNTSIFSTMRQMMPVILLLTAIYFIIIIGWYLIGLPLGINSSITM